MHDAAITTLQLAAARAWPAPTCKQLGDWWLRSAEGFTGRGNSVLPLGDPGLPLDDALDQVESFYRGMRYPAAVDVPLPLRSDVRAALRDRGWLVQSTVSVQSIPLVQLINATTPGTEFELLPAPSDDHLRMIRESRNMLPAAAMHLLTGVQPVTFAEHRRGGELVCRARGSVTDGFLGLIGIETAAAARGQGLATAAIGRLARWSRDHGATDVFLQVETSNTRAQRVYARLGFRTHHTYERYSPAH